MKLKYAKMHGVLAAILGGLSLFLIPSAVAAVADGPNEKVPFKLGVAGFTFKARTVDDALAIMQKADVHYLCVKNFHLPFEATDEEIASFKSKCALYGVTPYAYAIHNHGPQIGELFPDVEYGWNLVKDLDSRIGFCIDVGWEYGCGKAVIPAGHQGLIMEK